MLKLFDVDEKNEEKILKTYGEFFYELKEEKTINLEEKEREIFGDLTDEQFRFLIDLKILMFSIGYKLGNNKIM